MKIILFLISFSLISVVRGQDPLAAETSQPLEPYNFILGTNAIGGKYKFTSESKLFEQAQRIRVMGSNILKISLGPNSPKTYDLNIDKKITTTLDLFLSSPEYKKVFDMDFKYIFSWVHTNTGINWKNGINETQEKLLYDEMFNFASYLLKEYNNSHKTFLIGNWEGDWMLLPNYNRTMSPPKEHIQNMTKWFQIRQKAIDDAKKASGSKNVALYYYVEVNLVLKGLKGENCIASSILSEVNPDMVSYSSYEAIKNRTYSEKKNELERVFDYLEKQLKPKSSLPFSRRVFIGEYGYQANISDPASFRKQYNETKDIMKITLELNLPFALHWQMYNNEYGPDGDSKQMSLIDETGKKMLLYHLHKNYFDHMNSFLKKFKMMNQVYPSDTAFRKEALQFLAADAL
jgi:hypothetical protein